MLQTEIDEISSAFQEAWVDYFGDVMQYVPFDTTSSKNTLYQESKGKQYLWDEAKTFHGSLKEIQLPDVNQPTGKTNRKIYEITFVTKELTDVGVYYIDTNAVVKYVDRFGKEFIFHIYDDYQKVQLVNNKIFTKMKVRFDG